MGQFIMNIGRQQAVAPVLAVVLLTCLHPAWAQEETTGQQELDTGTMNHDAMPGMDHGVQSTPSKDQGHDLHHGDMTGMDGMNHGAKHEPSPSAMPGMDHSAMPGMDHGAAAASADGMTGRQPAAMQGGSPPADARDPHANSSGYTLDSGPYAMAGPRQLRLADEHHFGSLQMNRLETVRTADTAAAAYDLQAWYGGDYDRAVLKAEGRYDNGKSEEASTELLWGHAVTAYWNRHLGVRYDGGEGAKRGWLALGVQGLSPYWFELDATAYLGTAGRSALNLEAEYELLFTQKLILQPRIAADLYGKDDDERGIGAGLSELKAGVRLRYEIRRELAPYVGVEWAGAFGATADYARAAGQDPRETQAVAGVRFWF